MRLLSWAVVPIVVAVLAGCTAPSGPDVRRSPTRAPVVDARSCRESRPPGWLPSRPDGSKPFGTYFSLGRTPLDNEQGQAPPCDRSLHIQVDRLGPFRPSERTTGAGHHRHYREYRITVTNTLPHSVWLIDRTEVTPLDGDAPADRAVDLPRRIGVPPSDELGTGRRVRWTEAFSDDRGDQTVIVTPVLGGPFGGPTTTAIFADR